MIDDLIDQAARETDPLQRVALYYEIEERLFGPEDEHPVIPTATSYRFALAQPWIDGPYEHAISSSSWRIDWFTIDQEAQLAAQGR